MRGERAQITLFVLIGIAVLVIFLFLFLIRNELASTAEFNAFDTADEEKIETFVDACIDQAAKAGFQLSLSQGGIIFTVQGGLHVLETDHVGEAAELPVAYGLVMDSGWPFRPPPGSETNPDGEYRQNTYPLASVAYDDLLEEISASWGAPKNDGPYGQYVLPPLCNPEGSNDGDGLVACGPSITRSRFSSKVGCGSYDCSYPSLQESLEAYLSRTIETCVNEELATLATTLGTTAEPAVASARVTFLEQDTLVAVALPLRFTDSERALAVDSFERRYPVRFLKLFTYAHNLLKASSKNHAIHFSDAEDYQAIGGYDQFQVQQTRQAPNPEAEDSYVVSILDPLSSIDGTPAELQLLVENRPPVLGYIGASDGPHDATTPLSITAIDPEGEALSLTLEDESGNSLLALVSNTGEDYTLTLDSSTSSSAVTALLTATDPFGATDFQELEIAF
jgi:hypothetical protein